MDQLGLSNLGDDERTKLEDRNAALLALLRTACLLLEEAHGGAPRGRTRAFLERARRYWEDTEPPKPPNPVEVFREIVSQMGHCLSGFAASPAFSRDLNFSEWLIITTLHVDETMTQENIAVLTGMRLQRVQLTIRSLRKRGFIVYNSAGLKVVSELGMQAKATVDTLIEEMLLPLTSKNPLLLSGIAKALNNLVGLYVTAEPRI